MVSTPQLTDIGGRDTAKSEGWREINERLAQPRASLSSLSPSKSCEKEFEELDKANAHASKRNQ